MTHTESAGGDSALIEAVKPSRLLPDDEKKTDDDSTDKENNDATLCGDSMKLINQTDSRLLDNVTAVQYGFQLKGRYEHSKKYTDVIAMTYNGRMNQFVMLDTKGITCWNRNAVNGAVTRSLHYPKYEHKLLKDIIYARKYNVYFVLCKDFSLKVLNRDFEETCATSGELRSVLFMTFNSVKDELITGGVDGTRIWKFKQATEQNWGDIREMANYYLSLERHIKFDNKRFIRKVILEQTQQHLYYCSDTDFICYHMNDQQNPIFTIEKAHKMSITGCCYSAAARMLVTSSLDREVKVWSMTGGLIHTFRGHANSVTDILTHPEDSSLFITCSLDGTARTWSLITMTCIYSLQVSSEGVLYMGLTDDKLLYLGTSRTVTVWSVSLVTSFWAHSRSQVSSLTLVPGTRKSTRLMAVGNDGSVRIFSRPTHKNFSTVLPPPSVSPLEKVKQIVYNRVMNIVYVLIDEQNLWLYTSKTDPACMLMIWNLVKIQQQLISQRNEEDEKSLKRNPKRSLGTKSFGQRATESGLGNELFSNVTCIGCLDSPVQIWTAEGLHSPDAQNFLMLGLEDGRILFMDPVVKGHKIFEFKACKNPIKDIRQQNAPSGMLITLCSGIGMEEFLFWSLPSFDLLYQVSTLFIVSHYALLEECLMTGHETGAVHMHHLRKFDDELRRMPLESDNEMYGHHGPITSVDACLEMKVFLTCSSDGVLKIWDKTNTPLTEITLDPTLSCACFLNSEADIVIGFQNQISFIDHRKVCPKIQPAFNDDVPTDTESEIHEDPAVLFEGVEKDDDPVNMKNYLRHFKKDVIDQYVTHDEIIQMEDDDFNVIEREPAQPISPAPSEMYKSRQSTPSRLSDYDMQLSSQLRAGDIRDIFIAQDVEGISGGSTFELPQFGESPGPSPCPSTPSTPRTPTSSVLIVSDEGESTDTEVDFEDDYEAVTGSAQVDLKTDKQAEKKVTEVAKSEEKKEEKPHTPLFEIRNRASDIVIDSAAVLKEEAIRVKKASISKMSEMSQSVGTASVAPSSSQGSRASSAAARIKKKQLEGPRKRPKAKQIVEPPKDPSPEPPPVKTLPKKVLPRQRTRGFLELEAEAEEQAKMAAKPLEERSIEFKSRRHEVDMGSVIEKLEAPPSPTPEKLETPPPTLSTQDLKFQKSSAPRRQTKLTGKKVRSTSNFSVQQRSRDYAASDLRSRVSSKSASQKSGDNKPKKPEKMTNLLRKSKSERKTISAEDEKPQVRSIDVMMPDNYELTRKLSSEILNISDLKDSEEQLLLQQQERRRSKSVPLNDGVPSQFDTRSRTPGFLLDDESDWTIMMEGVSGKGDESQGRNVFSRPSTSFGGQRRPYTPAEQLVRPSKPQMDHLKDLFSLSKGDMAMCFAEEFQKYRGIPGTEDYIDSLHRNDGVYFDSSWHEKAITRHLLLRLQRELRAKIAADKRQKVDAAKAIQRTKMPYHRDCSTPAPDGFHMCFKKERAQTAPPNKEPRIPRARPNTANTILPKSEDLDMQQLQNKLSSEQPFRLRLHSTTPAAEPTSKISVEEIDLQMYDPRNAAARAFLLNPTKSIPSKCSRYVLVTEKKAGNSLHATPLEERLIEERFPGLQDHWIQPSEHPRVTRGPHRPSTAV